MTPVSASRFTVLAVDDDPAVLGCYARLLRRCGYRVLTEGDPRRLLADGCDLAAVDLIVLDYRMPGMDGLALLAELRRRSCRARCVLVSAYLNDAVRRQAKLLGVDRVLEKPVEAASLRDAISELLPEGGRRPRDLAG